MRRSDIHFRSWPGENEQHEARGTPIGRHYSINGGGQYHVAYRRILFNSGKSNYKAGCYDGALQMHQGRERYIGLEGLSAINSNKVGISLLPAINGTPP